MGSPRGHEKAYHPLQSYAEKIIEQLDPERTIDLPHLLCFTLTKSLHTDNFLVYVLRRNSCFKGSAIG